MLDFVRDLLGLGKEEVEGILAEEGREFVTEIGIRDEELRSLRNEFQFLHWKYLKKVRSLNLWMENVTNQMETIRESLESEEMSEEFDDVQSRKEYLEREEKRLSDEVQVLRENVVQQKMKIREIENRVERNERETESLRRINIEMEPMKVRLRRQLEVLKGKLQLLSRGQECEVKRQKNRAHVAELKRYNNSLLGKAIHLNDLKRLYSKSIEVHLQPAPFFQSRDEKEFVGRLRKTDQTLDESIARHIETLSLFTAINQIEKPMDFVQLGERTDVRELHKSRRAFSKAEAKTRAFLEAEKSNILRTLRRTADLSWLALEIREIENLTRRESDASLAESIELLEEENSKKAFNIQRLISFARFHSRPFHLRNFFVSPFEHLIRKRFILDESVLLNPGKRLLVFEKYGEFQRSLILDSSERRRRAKVRRRMQRKIEQSLADFCRQD